MIGTAEELREATEFHQTKLAEKSKEEKLEEWKDKFEKHCEKAIKEATRQGLYSCSLTLPFQPGLDKQAWNRSVMIDKKDLRVWVKGKLPGCQVEYSEEPMPGVKGGWFTLEISWCEH
jgi:hypothetical protein